MHDFNDWGGGPPADGGPPTDGGPLADGGPLESSPARSYGFTITDGAVTAMSETTGSHTVSLTLPSDATFSVSGTTVTETITGAQATTVVTYTPEASDASAYEISATTKTITTPSTTDAQGNTQGYGFTITDGTVTGETVTHSHGTQTVTDTLHLPADAVFTVGSGSVTETAVQGNAVVTTTFVQPSGGTLYAVSSVATTHVDAGTSTTQLSVDANDRLEFTFDSSGAVSAIDRVSASGTTTTVASNSHATFTSLGSGYVQETTTFGSHTSYEVYYAGQNADGVYTLVAHGSGSTVDLAGLEAQVAQLPTSVGWII